MAERSLGWSRSVECEIGVGPRQGHEREVVVALPGLEEERVEAEEDVVGAARRGEEHRGIGPSRLAAGRLPVEELGGVSPEAQAICVTTSAASAAGARTRPSRTIPAATGSTTNGSRKIRCLVSGEPELRASASAASGTNAAHAVSTRVSRGSTTSPAAAASSTATRTGNPAVKSPAASQT